MKKIKDIDAVKEFTSWESVSVVRITQGKNRGKDKITVTMYCPRCNGDVPVSLVVPQISNKIIYMNFPRRGKCDNCKRWVDILVPRKPTKKWKELADIEINRVWQEERYKYIPRVSSPSSNRKGRKKAMTAAQRDVFRQYKYDSILKMAS